MAVGSAVLEFASDEPLAHPVIAALYHAAPRSAAAPALHYRVERAGEGWLGLAPAKAPFGPASLEDVFAFLEWRATEDVMRVGGIFLHAAGINLGGRNTLLVGNSGSGKSSLAAHLLVRGHLAWGDDLVRFAPEERHFSAVPRSWKLDPKTLTSIYLLSVLSAESVQGTLLAPEVFYASPKAIRRSWQAPDAPADVVILLDGARHHGEPQLERVSEGEAALQAARMLIGGASGTSEGEQAEIMVRVVEAMRGVTAYRAGGTPPAAVASALELELAA